jgi:hypothetical protein
MSAPSQIEIAKPAPAQALSLHVGTMRPEGMEVRSAAGNRVALICGKPAEAQVIARAFAAMPEALLAMRRAWIFAKRSGDSLEAHAVQRCIEDAYERATGERL